MALPQTDTEVRDWLESLKLVALTDAFLAAGWRGQRLLELSREELADLEVPKAQRGEVMLAVEAFRQGDATPTLAEAQAPTYAPALTADAIATCRQLGLAPPAPWVEAVANQWPGPIAHEYQRLRQLLEQGQIVSAIFQLKDLAEVLVKFPALVMARDLIENGDEKATKAARQCLFSGFLSMGHWVGSIVGRTLAPETQRLQETGRLLLPELGAVFGTVGKSGKWKTSDWLEALGHLVTWRNETLGHGAFRLDPMEYLEELTVELATINRHLAAQVAQGVWADVVLRGEDEPLLVGWQAIRRWHEGPAGAAHHEREAPLWLEKAGQALRLTPLVMLRRCTVCARQDVFLYDSLSGRQPSDGFTLLDYLRGHRLSLPAHRAATLRTEAEDALSTLDTAALGNAETLEEDYGKKDINALLEEKLLEARYLRPDYLREPLRDFVNDHTQGVFWLTAPSHTGKSVFTDALAFPEPVGDKPLWSRTAVVVLHIRREFKTWPEQLREFIREAVLKKAFGRDAGRLPLPELDVKAADPAAALAELLHTAFRLKPSAIERLVLILDGLDELPASPKGEAGIADFIPRPEALPEGCFLLLTSRPLTDCPPHIQRALADRFTGCADFSAYALQFEQAGSAAYYQLLRAYFDRELEARLKNDLYQALAAFVQGCSEIVCRNDLGKAQPKAVAAFVSGEWARLTAAVRVRSPQEAPSLLSTVVQPVLAAYDAAFAEVRRKATDRFLYVAHLTDLLRDERLALSEVAALPVGSGLYVHFLRQLERSLVGAEAATTEDGAADNKLWAFVQRVILTLAAAEQAHVTFQQMLPVSVRDEVFRGVPLGILAALLDEPGRTVRLTFTLYSLKTILAVWKGEDSRDAHYALGLKDFVGAVAALWPEALQQTHRLLANQTLDALEGRWETMTDEEPLDRWRLLYLLAHAEWLEAADYRERVLGNEAIELAFDRLGSAKHSLALYAATARYWSLLLAIARRHVIDQNSSQSKNFLAKIYLNRGISLHANQDLGGAFKDVGKAIGFLEMLKKQLGNKWPLPWQRDLAMGYMNQGVIYQVSNDLSGAMIAFDKAIRLIVLLQKKLKDECPPDWINDLANAYANRANTHHVAKNQNKAIADYDKAIALMELLREKVVQEWPTSWANDLSKAYLNRSIIQKERKNLSGSLTDVGKSIELWEILIDQLGDECPLAWVNDLAEAYLNQGSIHHDNYNLSEALANIGRGIVIKESLREKLGIEWPPNWVNDLAMAYTIRSAIWSISKNSDGALEDSGEAITLWESLKNRLKEEWPPNWANALAMGYINRGNAYQENGNLLEAIAHYKKAIYLQEELKEKLGEKWPLDWANDLAVAYMNQGAARCESDDLHGALADYGKAITLQEMLRKKLGKEWPIDWADDLASTYMNRGNTHGTIGNLCEALVDYGQAIALREELRNCLGLEWPPGLANELARTYFNRGVVLEINNNVKAAIADWNKSEEIAMQAADRHPLYLGECLLKVTMYQFGSFYSLSQWSNTANYLLKFLNFHYQLETIWKAEKGQLEPPWQSVTIEFSERLNNLDPHERAALLEALGDEAEDIKELFGWNDSGDSRHD